MTYTFIPDLIAQTGLINPTGSKDYQLTAKATP
jgi:hypothetical protein